MDRKGTAAQEWRCAVAGASPTYLELDGEGQLVFGLGSQEITGVSVKDGSILWTINRAMGHGLMGFGGGGIQ